MTTPQVTHHLQRLLADGIRFDPHYLPSMNADHMPMTLCAMVGLGAGKDALNAYRADYGQILRPVVDSGAPLARWQDGLGDMAAYGPLLRFFRTAIADSDVIAVTREVLPAVLPAMAMAAFHPLIRLSYALDFGSDEEAAAGLAYMVSQNVAVPLDEQRVDIAAGLQAQVQAGPRDFATSRFAAGIKELLAAGEYPTGRASLADCASNALAVYRGTRNFFALHMVTAAQAARVCSRYVDEGDVECALTGALLAAHKVVGSPAFNQPLPVPAQMDREHNYKYAWVCLSEYRYSHNEIYLEELRAYRDAGLVPNWVAQEELS